MKILDSQPLTNEFLRSFFDNWESEPKDAQNTIEQLISGNILLEKPSPHKVHQELITADSQSTFYREIHKLAAQVPVQFDAVIKNLQQDSRMKMKNKGVISIDEHIIPHSCREMEGVDSFYSTTLDDNELGLSILMAHYYDRYVEYPAMFQGYRREEELKRWEKQQEFREKNEIARDMMKKLAERPNCPDLFLMDSFFMTKENVQLLQHLEKNYISRPRRNWKGSIGRHPKMDLYQYYQSIPLEEFEISMVKNPKTGKVKTYKTAIRDIYFPQIGTHRVVFINCDTETVEQDVIETHAEVITADSKRKFRVFLTNELTWTAAEILSLYALRWTIETSFRDMSQNLGLHGCKWRQLQGQYCFIALTLLSYLLLQWAKNNGALTRYGIENRTIEQLKMSFMHYCEERFALWLENLHKRCENCPVANWVYTHLYDGGKEL